MPEATSETVHEGAPERRTDAAATTDDPDTDGFPRLEDLAIPTCFSSPALDPVLQDSAARAREF
jgi:hypothetical protein